MDRDALLLIVGGGIALITSIITSLVQHMLSLRADRILREREEHRTRAQKVREALTARPIKSTEELKKELEFRESMALRRVAYDLGDYSLEEDEKESRGPEDAEPETPNQDVKG